MRVVRIEEDSRALHGTVLAIQDFNPGIPFAPFERDYIGKYQPVYVTCKASLDQIAAIHALERSGFCLIECQIRSAIKFRRTFDVSAFDYDFLEVTDERDLAEVFDIASSTFVHDRMRTDPAIPPECAVARYREYIWKSFRSPKESVYRLVDRSTGRVDAFKTHAYINDTDVLFLLGGVHADLKNAGLGPINGFFEVNELIRKGYKSGTTHVSAANSPIVNLEIGKLGFRVVNTFAVMRKLYAPYV